MNIMPTDAALGIEVTGLDLRNSLDQADRNALREALLKSGVLFFRNQKLDEHQFVNFARSFGKIESYESTLRKFLLPSRPEIIVLSNIVDNGEPIGVADAGSYWHTDRSYVSKPAWCSCLYSLEVPHADDGTPLGDTEFASMISAYNALSESKQKQLLKLSAWHEYVFRFSEKNDSMPGMRHPVVLRHPLTRVPCLYVNKGFTHRILDMPEKESQTLLNELFEHSQREDFIYRHRWKVGDVLLWDNYSTQHRATGGYTLPQRRHMWRTTIQGFVLQ